MEIEVTSPILAEAEVKRYTLVSDDIYVKRYDESTIPDWYRSLIDNVLATSGTIGSLETTLDSIQSVQDGYAISISNLETADSSLLANYQTQQTSIDGLTSTISNLGLTYATRDYAQTVVDDTIAATFGTDGLAGSWFNSQISTYASDITSNASAITTIGSVTNQNSATITTIQDTVTTLDSAVAKAAQYVTATVGGTEVVTGWSMVSSIDPAGDQISKVVFNADDFRIYTTTTIPNDTATPVFQVTGNEVNFNGTVSINKLASSIHIGTFTNLTIPSNPTFEFGGQIYTIKDGDTYLNSDDGIVYAYSDGTWISTQGNDGADGVDGYTPVKGVDYFDGIDGLDGSDGDSAYAAWLAAGNTGTTTDFLNSLVGADGLDGSDGIHGTDGVDGITTYTWIKYADSADGVTGFSNVPTDKPYIGFAFNKTTAVESEVPTDYTWSLIKGADGTDGTDGVRGTVSVFKTFTSTPTDTELTNAIYAVVNPDTLMNGDNVIYTIATSGTKQAYYNGVSWIKDVALYVNGDAVIDGTLSATKFTGNTTWEDGALQSSDFSAFTTGFRLKSNAAGTSADPTIYGAYIKGGTIDGISIQGASIDASTNLTAPFIYVDRVLISSATNGNYGQTYYITDPVFNGGGNATSTQDLYGHAYGSGYLESRVCDLTNGSKILISFMSIYISTRAHTVYFDRSLDGGSTWTQFTSRTAYSMSGEIEDTGISPNFTRVRYRIRSSAGNNLSLQVKLFN